MSNVQDQKLTVRDTHKLEVLFDKELNPDGLREARYKFEEKFFASPQYVTMSPDAYSTLRIALKPHHWTGQDPITIFGMEIRIEYSFTDKQWLVGKEESLVREE